MALNDICFGEGDASGVALLQRGNVGEITEISARLLAAQVIEQARGNVGAVLDGLLGPGRTAGSIETGDRLVAGVSLTASVSLLAGESTATGGGGDGNAPGATVTVAITVLGGDATASASADGAIFARSTALVTGVPGASSTADGQLLAVTTQLIAGSAQVSIEVGGAVITAAASFITGAVSAASLAQGFLASVQASLIAGAFDGDGVSMIEGPPGTEDFRRKGRATRPAQVQTSARWGGTIRARRSKA